MFISSIGRRPSGRAVVSNQMCDFASTLLCQIEENAIS